jgi:addiction module HigA family antidote
MSTSNSPTDVLEQDETGAYIAAPEPAFGPTHPGALLSEDFETLGLSVSEAARKLRVSRQTLHNILACRQSVTPDMALRIGKLLGNGPTLWLNMQSAWDLHAARRQLGAELDQIETLSC